MPEADIAAPKADKVRKLQHERLLTTWHEASASSSSPLPAVWDRLPTIIAQAFLYPPSLNLKTNSARLGIKRKRVAYILRNGRLFRPEKEVKRQTLAIATQAISTMTATSGVNDTFRMYVTTKRDGVGFNLAYIDTDFTLPYKGPFDQGYMRALFEYGYDKGKAGYHWHKTPPGYQE